MYFSRGRMPLQPLAPATEHTLSLPQFAPASPSGLGTRCSFHRSQARSAAETPSSGSGSAAARTRSVDQLFGALGERFAEIARNPKYATRGMQLAKHALLPSRVFEDTAVWTGQLGCRATDRGPGRVPERPLHLSAHPGVPAPKKPADGRHIITLSKLSDGEYRWDTTVDFAIGTIRPNDVAAVFSRLISSAEGKSAAEVRADLASSAPRTSTAFGMAFSLDSVVPTRLADGSTAVTLGVGDAIGSAAAALSRLRRLLPQVRRPGAVPRPRHRPRGHALLRGDRSGSAADDPPAHDCEERSCRSPGRRCRCRTRSSCSWTSRRPSSTSASVFTGSARSSSTCGRARRTTGG